MKNALCLITYKPNDNFVSFFFLVGTISNADGSSSCGIGTIIGTIDKDCP